MVNYQKVARIVRRLREYKSKTVNIPEGDSITGAPSSSSNSDETPGREEDPFSKNMPKDIGFFNSQTIAGTGTGGII